MKWSARLGFGPQKFGCVTDSPAALFPSPGTPGEGREGGFLVWISFPSSASQTPSPTLPRRTDGGRKGLAKVSHTPEAQISTRASPGHTFSPMKSHTEYLTF